MTALEDRVVPADIVGPLPPVDHPFVADRVIVGLQSGAAPKSPLARRVEELGFGLYSVQLRRGVTVERALKHFHAQRGVSLAEPDYIVYADAIPNDPSFSSLYGMHNTGQTGGTADADIDAPEAWDIETGTGNIVVAVIDTGVDYNHPDLAANMWRNPGEVAGNGVDDDGNGFDRRRPRVRLRQQRRRPDGRPRARHPRAPGPSGRWAITASAWPGSTGTCRSWP